MTETEEALQDLVSSKGFLLFKEYARKAWGPEGYGKRVAAVMAQYQDDPVALGLHLRMVHTATEEINTLMKWPEQELKKTAAPIERGLHMQRGGA